MKAIIKTDPKQAARYLKGKRVHVIFINQPETVFKRRIVRVEIPTQSEYSYATIHLYLDTPLVGGEELSYVELFVEPERFDWCNGIFRSNERVGNVLMKTARWVRQNRPRPWRWKLYLARQRFRALIRKFTHLCAA